MGLFENLGRSVEKFKQAAEKAAASDETAGCPSCGETFYEQPDTCPECGSEDIVPLGDE